MWFDEPTTNNKDTPITLEIPRVQNYLPRAKTKARFLGKINGNNNNDMSNKKQK